jgi:hypothetical protein
MFRIVELNRTQKWPHVSICSCYNFDVCAIFSPFHQLAGGNHIMHKVRMPMVQRAQFATPPFVANKQQRTNFRKTTEHFCAKDSGDPRPWNIPTTNRT